MGVDLFKLDLAWAIPIRGLAIVGQTPTVLIYGLAQSCSSFDADTVAGVKRILFSCSLLPISIPNAEFTGYLFSSTVRCTGIFQTGIAITELYCRLFR